jgi:hypothetical protein
MGRRIYIFGTMKFLTILGRRTTGQYIITAHLSLERKFTP